MSPYIVTRENIFGTKILSRISKIAVCAPWPSFHIKSTRMIVTFLKGQGDWELRHL